jgi:hypothetical protein
MYGMISHRPHCIGHAKETNPLWHRYVDGLMLFVMWLVASSALVAWWLILWMKNGQREMDLDNGVVGLSNLSHHDTDSHRPRRQRQLYRECGVHAIAFGSVFRARATVGRVVGGKGVFLSTFFTVVVY